ncbi:hypothetical protein GOODEAATRI_008112 [Goodea atripinnis]|uniref:Uncharacterized protein n=1 Tax=Goodea atripinnis TaxID=208336 RepID=A0ABV0MH18_9TELE
MRGGARLPPLQSVENKVTATRQDTTDNNGKRVSWRRFAVDAVLAVMRCPVHRSGLTSAAARDFELLMRMQSPHLTGSLPLRHRMDDEEEDMSLPIPQLRVLPFGDIKYEDRATQIAAGQALAAVTAAVATSQGHNNNGINALSCSIHLQPHVPFNGEKWRDILTLIRKKQKW